MKLDLAYAQGGPPKITTKNELKIKEFKERFGGEKGQPGQVKQTHIDYADGRSENIQFFYYQGANGKWKRLPIFFSDKDLKSFSGEMIVRGNLYASTEGDVLIVSPEKGGSVELAEQATVVTPPKLGKRSVLAIKVNLLDAEAACSLDEIKNIMFSGPESVSGYFAENSFGRMTFPIDSNSDGQVDVIEVSIPFSKSETCISLCLGATRGRA